VSFGIWFAFNENVIYLLQVKSVLLKFNKKEEYMVNMYKRGAFLLSIFLFLISSGYTSERFQVGVSFNPGFPINEFKSNVKKAGLGGSGDFVFRLKDSPLSIGASFGLMIYGSESRQERLSAEIPEVIVDVRTRNSILMCHLFLRLQPQQGKIKPYLDGLIGLSYLWTETGIYDSDGFHREIASDVNFSDWTWNFGIGGGLMFPVYEKRKERKSGAFAVFLDLSARYLKGGKAQYLKEGSIIRENERMIYNIDESSTDLITVRAGLSVAF
jgi:hypothetical protein